MTYTAVYYQHYKRHEEDHETMRDAVHFLRDGEDAGAMSAESIIDHNGEVTEGSDLDALIWE